VPVSSIEPERARRPLPVAVAGSVLAAGGLSALTAWAAGLPDFTQLDSGRGVLHYNAAFGLVAWGLGYFALAANRLRAARWSAAGLGAIAVALLVGRTPGAAGLVNDWAFAPPPGRAPEPAPDLAAGMLLGAAALVLAARPVTGRRDVALTAVGGAQLVVGALSLLFASGWPLLDGLALIVAGAGLALAAGRVRVPRPVLPIGLPAGVAVAGAVLTVALWIGLNAEQGDRIERQAQFEAAHAVASAREGLNGRLTTLADLAARSAQNEPDRVREDAGSFVGLTPASLGVARVGSDLRLTWIETRQNPPPPTALDELGIADLVAAGVRDGQLAVGRPPRSCWNGVRTLVVFAPVRPNTPGSGGLVSVFRLQELFGAALNQNVAPGYAIRVSDGDDLLFTRLAPDKAPDRWRQTLAFPFRDRNWTMEAWPTDEVLNRESLSLPRLALMIGALTTGLLALAVQLAQTAGRRARALEAEAREREAAQRALVQSEQKYRTTSGRASSSRTATAGTWRPTRSSAGPSGGPRRTSWAGPPPTCSTPAGPPGTPRRSAPSWPRASRSKPKRTATWPAAAWSSAGC